MARLDGHTVAAGKVVFHRARPGALKAGASNPACPPALARPRQALSKRIHYGMFVAEAKFRKQTAEYSELIRRQDAAAILELLTDRAVELKVG